MLFGMALVKGEALEDHIGGLVRRHVIEVGGPAPVFELAGGESLSAALGNRRYVTRHLVALPAELGLVGHHGHDDGGHRAGAP